MNGSTLRGRRAWRHPRLMIAVAIATLLSSMLVTTTTGNEGSSRAPDPALQNALNFRRAMGLDTDPGDIQRLMADPRANRTYATPLSADEAAEMDRRMDLQDRLGPLQAYGRSKAASFGGGFIDQAAGGVIDIAFTDRVESHRAAVQSRAPIGATVRIRQVARSEQALDALVADITDDRPFFDSLGVTLGAASTDIRGNVVQVEIEPLAGPAVATIQERYGPGVRVVAGAAAPQLTACTSRDNCLGPPVRAGISTTYGCTVGFLVNEDGAYRWMTAGHCAQQNYNWYHSVNNYALGYTRDERWYNNSPADVGTVGNISAAYVSNRVYYTASSWFGMYSAQSSSADFVGQVVCQSGRRSGYQCGSIQSRNVSVPYWDTACGCYTTIINQRKANYFVQVGDSGAPVINSSNTNQAVGIQSGKDGDYIAYYSQISIALSLLNATLRTIDY